MSEVTITGLFEKANNIFSLFKALLTPGKFQDSVLWQKEVLIILALGLCLITAISFIAFNLISTLKKRQRNYKDLVSALEEDGTELDYNLKPLDVDKITVPTLLPNEKNQDCSYENSTNDLQYEKYPEELASKLVDEPYPQSNFSKSKQFNPNSEISPSPLITETKIFTLTVNHLANDQQKQDKKASKVLHLSMKNLKVEPVNSDNLTNDSLPLEKKFFSQENIYSSDNIQSVASNVNSNVMNVSEYSEKNLPLTSPDNIDNTFIGLDSFNNKNDDLNESSVETYHEKESNGLESSIWDEVEEVITDLENFNSENEVKQVSPQSGSEEIYEDYDCLSNNEPVDPMELEAESVLNEFTNEEVWSNQEETNQELSQNLPSSVGESSTNSANNRKEPADESFKDAKIDNKKILPKTNKAIEFLSIEDDPRYENIDSVPEPNPSEILDGSIVNDESESTDDSDENISHLNVHDYDTNEYSTEPHPENNNNYFIDTEMTENNHVLSNDTEDQSISSSEEFDMNENIINHIEENKIETFEDSADESQNCFEQTSHTEHDTSVSNNDHIPHTVEKLNIVDTRNETSDQNESLQLLLDLEIDSKIEFPKTIEKNISGSNQLETCEKGKNNQLSPKTVKRILDRLEFFQKNIKKKF